MRHLLLLAMLVLTTLPAAAEGPFDVVGVWEVQHTDGTPICFVVEDDGTAANDWQDGTTGTWRWEGETVVFDWADGWRDVISRNADGTFTKVAWGPGVDRQAEPTNRTSAFKRGPQPVPGPQGRPHTP